MFRRDNSNPDDQAFRDGKQIHSGTLGPYAPANSDPTSYKNKFISELRSNPPSYDFYSKVFSAQDAQQSQSKIDALGVQPNFINAGDQTLAQDFLIKYLQGGQRGLVPRDEMVTQQTIANIQSQQPGQGIGDSRITAADKIRYPGASGTQTS